MEYGVLVDGEFEKRELIDMSAKGFTQPLKGRADTYDHYVMKEIVRSYGKLNVKDKVVLDIGANIGCFTAWALQQGASHVIALEPEPNNMEILKLNANVLNVTLINAALHSTSDEDAILYLAPSGKNPGNSTTTPRRGRVELKIRQMSVKMLKSVLPRIDVAKIDCEGAEYEFIETLVPAYPMLKEMALEIHISGHGVDKAQRLHDYVTSQGFKAVVPPRIQDNLWQTLATYRRD